MDFSLSSFDRFITLVGIGTFHSVMAFSNARVKNWFSVLISSCSVTKFTKVFSVVLIFWSTPECWGGQINPICSYSAWFNNRWAGVKLWIISHQWICWSLFFQLHKKRLWFWNAIFVCFLNCSQNHLNPSPSVVRVYGCLFSEQGD